MAIKFTPEQQKVIELHNRNILVSAAAGSGKTAVLVERIIRMICDGEHPVDIDRLLIVTFTNAAAAEMRERIANGIAARLELDPENEHIQKQSTLLHNAQITTIDSFSLFLIRNHFNEIGLDPAFRVADEGEIKLLQQEVLKQLLEDSFAGDGTETGAKKVKAFQECVEYFCPGGKESVLEQHIWNLSRYASSFPWPQEWLEQRKKDYAAADVNTLVNSDYGRYLTQYVSRMLEGCLDKLKEVRRLSESPDGPYMYGELVDQEIEQLEKLCSCKTLEEQAAGVPSMTFGRLPSKKDDSVNPNKRELAKSIRAEVKDILGKLTEHFFTTPLELAAVQGSACAGPVETLIDLVLEFDRRMTASKQERKLIDFSDMEHYALQILLIRENGEVRPSPVALEYRQYFKEILIDEYQDSNLVQEYLLKAVSGEEDGQFNRFMVGDVKQSIYRFRLARPELFLEKYHTYGEAGDRCRIDLARNFRSRVQVVDTVNAIFSRMMSQQIGGIAYDEKAALYPGAAYPAQEDEALASELLLVEKPTEGTPYNPRQLEALAIAGRIKKLMETFQVTDKTGVLRPVRFSDMVILLRTTSGWDEEFKQVLEEQGIPVYITSKTGYFGATEVQELLQLLRVLDNPRQDIPLFGVLKSLFGGFSEEEIADIRSRYKEGSLYEALQAVAEAQEPDKLSQRVVSFLSALHSYRDMTAYLPIRDLLKRLVDDFDYLNYVTALPAGSKRRANVEMLLTKASDFEKTSYFGLFHFIRYMEQLEKYDVDYGEADTLDENADVVRIMSIHKSKGLEFPVVFVAGLSKRFNLQDTNQSLIVDMDLGVATDYVDPGKRLRNRTLRRMALSRKGKEDSLSEELRVLYVALTRAREKLILSATLEKSREKWERSQLLDQERLTYLDFCEAGSYLDMLLPILHKTGVRVALLTQEDLLAEDFKEQFVLENRRDALTQAARKADPQQLASLRERFAYAYPYPGLQKLYTKTTVSELKIAAMAEKDQEAYQMFEEKEIIPYIPAFRRTQEKVSGTVRGNAYHRVMELLDFEFLLHQWFPEFPKTYAAYQAQWEKDTADREMERRLQEFLQRETESLRLTKEYAQAVSPDKILHFLKQEIAYRMYAAERRGELYREQPFVLGIDAGRLDQELPKEEKVLIQGIIDVFFAENGQLVLLDYKTDVISSLADLWNRYAIQLDYYEEALTKLMGLPVKEKLLYSFYLEAYR